MAESPPRPRAYRITATDVQTLQHVRQILQNLEQEGHLTGRARVELERMLGRIVTAPLQDPFTF